MPPPPPPPPVGFFVLAGLGVLTGLGVRVALGVFVFTGVPTIAVAFGVAVPVSGASVFATWVSWSESPVGRMGMSAM